MTAYILKLVILLGSECLPPKFADGCNSTCHCADNALCDPVTGKCPGDCEDGWRGESCSVPYVDGKKFTCTLHVCYCQIFKF